MTTTNKKPKINRVKAKKQLKLLRKRTLLLRKKAIRRYRLRCLKTADSLVLRARDTRAPSALRYARQLTAMHRARRFNRHLYLRGKVSAVRAAASAPAGRYFPPVNRAAKRRVSQNASAFRALQCARVQALLVSRYRRRVRTAFRPAKNLFPLLAQRKATTTRGARQLRKRLYRKLRPFRSQLLARRAATFSQGKARRGLRLRNTRGRAFSVRFSKQLTSATAEGRAKQLLLFAATEATPLNELESPAQPRTPLRGRQERKQTYALAKKRLVHSAKLFAIYRRTPGKLKYLVRRVRKIRRFFSVRRTTKASLRDRFFARTSLSSRTLTRRVLPLPKVVSTQTYATSYLTRSGARRTLQLWKFSRSQAVQQGLRGALRSRGVAPKGQALRKAFSAATMPAQVLPAAYNLRVSSLKTQYSAAKAFVSSELAAYHAAQRSVQLSSQLATPTRRQRRAVAKVARLRQNVSKGQQKRLRLGRVLRASKPARYPRLQHTLRKTTIVSWKRRPTPARRSLIFKQLGTITSALTQFTRLERRYAAKGVPVRPVNMLNPFHAERVALWALLSVAKKYRPLVSTNPKKLKDLELLVLRLRCVLRSGTHRFMHQITPTFHFLLQICPANAGELKKLLYFNLRRWLHCPLSSTSAVRVAVPTWRRGKLSLFRGLLRKAKHGQVRSTGRKTIRSARTLSLLLSGEHVGARYTFRRTLRGLAAKFKSVDQNRRKLRAALLFNEPRPTRYSATAALPVPTTATDLALSELNSYVRELPRTTAVATEQSPLPLTYLPAHAGAATSNLVNRKYHLRPTSRRKTVYTRKYHRRRKPRFVKYIRSYKKRREVYARNVVRNKVAAPGRRAAVTRYFRFVYSKGNKIFVARYRKGRRIAARRLLARRRWTRSTFRRLNRRRPGWRHFPYRRSVKFSTGAVTRDAQRAYSKSGWRARKAAIKSRGPLRAQADRFKNILLQLSTMLPETTITAQQGTVPRILQLLTTSNNPALSTESLPVTGAQPVAVTAFHKMCRTLSSLRSLRTTHTRCRFKSALRLGARRRYKRRRGHFRQLKARRRRHKKRTPRWASLISVTSGRVLSFARPRAPKLVASTHGASTFTASSTHVRDQLWSSVSRFRSHAKKRGAAVAARVEKTAVKQNTVYTASQAVLVKKLRRLSLLKKLLRGNKFSKLARLGELHALGDHTYLANLGKLFDLGSFTNELKQTLLFKLALDIKLCATLLAQDNAEHTPLGVIEAVANRTLFVYKKQPTTFGRDPEFFQPDDIGAKITSRQVARQKALLRTVAACRSGNRPADTRLVLARTALTKRLVVARKLQQRQRLFSPAYTTNTEKHGKSNSWTLASSLSILRSKRLKALRRRFKARRRKVKALRRHAKRWADRKAGLRVIRPRRVKRLRKTGTPLRGAGRTARYISLHKLPPTYLGVVRPLTSAQLWASRHGIWSRKSNRRALTGKVVTQTHKLAKSFSVARPWGVKTLYTGVVAAEYSRFERDAAYAVLKTKSEVALPNAARLAYVPWLASFRAVAAKAVRAYAAPKIIRTLAFGDKKFWHLRRRSRTQLRARVRSRLFAVAAIRGKVPTISGEAATRVVSNYQSTKIKKHAVRNASVTKTLSRPAKIRATPVKPSKNPLKTKPIKPKFKPKFKPPFKSYTIKPLNIVVFDDSVRSNLQQFTKLPTADQEDSEGYELVRRAYKAALSSQERTPALPDLQYEQQKLAVYPFLEKLGGVRQKDTKILEWGQLPKNQSKGRRPSPAAQAVTLPAGVDVLTTAELDSIVDAHTKALLKSFVASPDTKKQSAAGYTGVKRAVLHAWTMVENANTPKDSPHYNDLLLAAKAYSFYGVTLDLTSKATTVSKLASTYAKLPK